MSGTLTMSKPVNPLETDSNYHATQPNNSTEFDKTLDDIFDILTVPMPKPPTLPTPMDEPYLSPHNWESVIE